MLAALLQLAPCPLWRLEAAIAPGPTIPPASPAQGSPTPEEAPQPMQVILTFALSQLSFGLSKVLYSSTLRGSVLWIVLESLGHLVTRQHPTQVITRKVIELSHASFCDSLWQQHNH